jgi:hypothetical protein
MKFTLILLSALPVIMALPLYQGTPECEYSVFEKLNLGHNHDVNTGELLSDLFGDKKILKGFPRLLGSGCSPKWAVGGPLDDTTPTKTPSGY